MTYTGVGPAVIRSRIDDGDHVDLAFQAVYLPDQFPLWLQFCLPPAVSVVDR